ncbi:MAG: GNAT family N-acetyltransferase [Bacteroidia bacterium]|nr:GNAT family N-acetyltransferase [Bacteroidia bacterium]
MKDLPEEFTREDFPDSGWKIFYPDLTMQMQIRKQWKDFEDYAADLRKNYRKRARKIRDSGRGLERKEITEAEFENLSSNIRNLFLQVAMRQTVRIGIIDENYFREMFRALGPDFRMRGYYHQDELIAFASYIYHPEKLEIHYIGINYSFNHTFNLYFNLLFDAVECSIKSGKRFLEMGRTARTAKAVTGGIPVRFNDFIWTGNRITALLLGVMTKYFQKKMGEDWKKRNPFINIDT